MNRFISFLETLIAPVLGQEKTFWMPAQRSTYAAEVDWVFYFILWLSAFFFVGIVGTMVYFVFKYRARDGHGPQPSPHHNLKLELVWTIIPLILVIYIFIVGFNRFMELSVPPQNAYEVQVTAIKWSWMFTYPNGHIDDTLHVPVDRNIRLVMTSEDVLHSIYVPAFRMKMDVVPGRYRKAWFNATEVGEYDLFCAEYCGQKHSDMITKVVVHPAGEFDAWLEKASNIHANMSPVEAGGLLYKRRGCAQCHSVDGAAGTGPTFKNVFGSRHALASGGEVEVEENYIRESILEPQAKIVAGYQPVMPTYKGKLTDQDITAIIEYIKSLKEQ